MGETRRTRSLAQSGRVIVGAGMSNDPNNRGPGGWPPPPPGTPYGAPTPYGTAPQQPQAQAPVAQYPAPQYPAPQPYPQPQQPYPQPQQPYAQAPAHPYAQQPYGYPQAQQPIQVVVQNQIQPYGYAQPYAYPNGGLKKDTAILLCLLGFFFGINGLQRFYLRQTGLGILYFLTGGLCVVGQIVDAIQLLSMSQQEFDRRYNYPQLR
jgi:hypothetical protein